MSEQGLLRAICFWILVGFEVFQRDKKQKIFVAG